MIYRLLLIPLLVVFLGACANTNKDTPAPEDFIIKQDTSLVTVDLNQLDGSDYVVKFQKGSTEISQRQQERLLKWINETQPTMIAVRGTGGAEKYRDLGNSRAMAAIALLRANRIGIDILKLDYNPSLAGGRAVIHALDNELVAKVYTNAPMLIIKSD